ncbi:MAG: Phosphoglycolate phosphatase [Promethearchaeota archaeon]|nr:MAG: Phosphoglycolate phosphatase [Candidatus Lokiarchaeota archaeon]
MNRLKAVVWDLDGTLIHFRIDYLRARRAAIKILKQHGVAKQELTITKSILDNLKISIDFFKRSGYSANRIAQVKHEINDAVSEIELEAAHQATKVKGIEEVLNYAKQKDLKQAIYTYNTHKNAEVSLQTINLRNYFDLIVGRDDVNNPKPHNEHLITICNLLEVKPIHIVVIGDTYRDIQGALQVGARSIAIRSPTSKLTNDHLFQHADFIITQKAIEEKLIPIIASLL